MTYQLLPNLTPDEYDALRGDIAARGVMVPVELDETGAILDGHHRAAIAQDLGIEYPTVERAGWTEDQKIGHVFALNLARRQLTREQRADVVADLRRRRMSTRRIAALVGASEATVRADLGSIAQNHAMPETIETADGRSYPARRSTLDPEAMRGLEALAAHPDVQAAGERARWSSLLAANARVLTEATPDYWRDRLDRQQAASLRSYLNTLRGWIDRWEAALAEPSLHVLGG